MRTRLLNLLLLAALAFAASRLWQFLSEPPPALPVVAVATTASAGPAAAKEEPAEAAEFRPESYDIIVARDLFSPTRGVVAPAPSAAPKPVPKPVPPPKLTLYGVVILDGEKSAYLQEGTQEAKPRKVREGENFAGGVVKSIRPDAITFSFAGSEITVLLRTPKDGASTPATVGKAAIGGAIPRSEAPVAFPRRTTQSVVQPGQMPIPGRPMPAAPAMPAVVAPTEPGNENFGDEEIPEEMMPAQDLPGGSEEEQKE